MITFFDKLKCVFALTLISLTTISQGQNFTNGFNFNLPFDDGTPSVFLPNFPAKNNGVYFVRVGGHDAEIFGAALMLLNG
jgi:hypothetical protein